ncbi:unnamed protein product, partial [Amoebophrya sp. A25]
RAVARAREKELEITRETSEIRFIQNQSGPRVTDVGWPLNSPREYPGLEHGAEIFGEAFKQIALEKFADRDFLSKAMDEMSLRDCMSLADMDQELKTLVKQEQKRRAGGIVAGLGDG